MSEIHPKARELLGQALIGNLGFNGLDGYPRVIPVWFRFTGDEVQVATPPGSYKSRALARDPRATLTVSTATQPYHVASVTGDAVIDVLEEGRRVAFVGEVAPRYLGAEAGRRYVEDWMKGGHPGPGELIRVPATRVRYTNVSGE